MTWESRVLSPWCGFESTRFSAFTDREAVRPEDSHLDCECSGTVLPESPEEHGESTVRWSVETPHHLQGPEISDYKILREMLGRFNALTSVSNFCERNFNHFQVSLHSQQPTSEPVWEIRLREGFAHCLIHKDTTARISDETWN